MSPRLAGAMMVVAGLLGFVTGYGWLVGLRVDDAIAPIGFNAGLIVALAVCLPIMSAGLYFVMHGRPDVEGHAARQRIHQLLKTAQTEGHASTHEFISRYGMPRRLLRPALALGARSIGFQGYVNWRAGRVVAMERQSTLRCPACGGPLPEPELAASLEPGATNAPDDLVLQVCPTCHVDIL
jgi:hypothetical protein